MKKNIYQIKYQSKLDLYKTQEAIKFVKDTFQKYLVKELHLLRVSAPLFVTHKSGLNDNLSGVEEAVKFNIPSLDDDIEIIHSLAKWKRMALKKYDIYLEHGLYTDMNAIRKDEHLDFIHSLYVDQWDWERAISKEQRNLKYLKYIVRKIYKCIYKLSLDTMKKYPSLKVDLPKNITFINSSKLQEMYPHLSSKEREDAITRKYKAVFIYEIGYPLKGTNKPHDLRAADYDDWKLNGDILVYYPLYDMALELSSMGIRVDATSLKEQLAYKNELYKLNNPYCQAILHDELPLSIGGGIGQSRLAMFMLNKAHIGEVQVSIWDQEEVKRLKEKGINLL